MVRCYIGGVGHDCHRSSKINLLPARSSFSSKGCLSFQVSINVPQAPYVGTGIGGTFVKTNTGNKTTNTGAEFHPQLNRRGVRIGRYNGGCRDRPDGGRRRRCGCDSDAEQLGRSLPGVGGIAHIDGEAVRTKSSWSPSDVPAVVR